MKNIVFVTKKQWVGSLVGFLCLIHVLDGYPSGAGLSACSTLKPNHEDAPEPSKYTSPYSVQVEDDIRIYTAGFPITGKWAS